MAKAQSRFMLVRTLSPVLLLLLLFNSHQEMHIKSIKSSISCNNNTEQLKTPSLTNSNSNKYNTEALSRSEIYASTQHCAFKIFNKLECGPMPNVMVALPNIGGALCSTLQSLADAHY